MQDLASFYSGKIDKYQAQLSQVKKRLFASSMVRLVVFCLAIVGVYLIYGNTKWVVAIVLLSIIVFLFLVSRHSDLKHKNDWLNALIAINKTEINVLRRDFYDLPDGNQFKDPTHYFSQDIDLFGRGSFYQYANRTALAQGGETLATLLKQNAIEKIDEKQEAIKELAQLTEWRQNFSAIASLTKMETSAKNSTDWLANYKAFLPQPMRYVPWVFSTLTLVVVTAYFLDTLPESALMVWLILGLGVTGFYMKKIKVLGDRASKVQSTFQQYNKLLQLIEDREFNSELLKDLRSRVISESERTSVIIKRFSGHLNSLDKNGNVFYLFFANGYFLRTLSHLFAIEKWIALHGASVEKWFEVIAIFDAYNSLGNFAFNHPKFAFPQLSKENIVLKSKAAGHPLLDPEKTVLNDFQIDREEFFIITGANMAGKSTFLRSVALQIMMANVGLPVCSQETTYRPIKLITSMRTTDSLTDDESYFFAELKRLKFVVEQIQIDNYFIVLDEILKGTNSTDKAKGSRQFVERLVNSRSTGIIATHDLSLCEISEEYSQIENHYFDAEIIDNELHFDYKLKGGVCQNMNASFLLKKMKIV